MDIWDKMSFDKRISLFKLSWFSIGFWMKG